MQFRAWITLNTLDGNCSVDDSTQVGEGLALYVSLLKQQSSIPDSFSHLLQSSYLCR